MEDWDNVNLLCKVWFCSDPELYFPEDQELNLGRLYEQFKSRLLQELSEAGLEIRPIQEPEKEKEIKYGCHCDLEKGQKPDKCVIDARDYEDCIHAKPGMKKEECEYWRKIED